MSTLSIHFFDLSHARRISLIDVQMDIVRERRVERKSADLTVPATDMVDVNAIELRIRFSGHGSSRRQLRALNTTLSADVEVVPLGAILGDEA